MSELSTSAPPKLWFDEQLDLVGTGHEIRANGSVQRQEIFVVLLNNLGIPVSYPDVETIIKADPLDVKEKLNQDLKGRGLSQFVVYSIFRQGQLMLSHRFSERQATVLLTRDKRMIEDKVPNLEAQRFLEAAFSLKVDNENDQLIPVINTGRRRAKMMRVAGSCYCGVTLKRLGGSVDEFVEDVDLVNKVIFDKFQRNGSDGRGGLKPFLVGKVVGDQNSRYQFQLDSVMLENC